MHFLVINCITVHKNLVSIVVDQNLLFAPVPAIQIVKIRFLCFNHFWRVPLPLWSWVNDAKECVVEEKLCHVPELLTFFLENFSDSPEGKSACPNRRRPSGIIEAISDVKQKIVVVALMKSLVDSISEYKGHETDNKEGRKKDWHGKQGKVKAFLLGDHLKVSSLHASFFILQIHLFVGLVEQLLQVLLKGRVCVFLLQAALLRLFLDRVGAWSLSVTSVAFRLVIIISWHFWLSQGLQRLQLFTQHLSFFNDLMVVSDRQVGKVEVLLT